MAAGAGIDGGRGSDPRVDPAPRRASAAASVRAGLAGIIEGEVLPRLALAHGAGPSRPAATPIPPTAERVAALARLLIAREADAAIVRDLVSEGLTLSTLLLDLLAPAARHLGRLWEEDEADFIDVTLGLGRLQGLAHALCARLEAPAVRASARRILLLPCPGETHVFSLTLVASFFREAGWDVALARGDGDPLARVRSERFDLVGVSLSCDRLVPVMAGLVAALRNASCNPGLRVLVGGPLFLRDPARASAVGADATAMDGPSAVRIAETLCAGCRPVGGAS